MSSESMAADEVVRLSTDIVRMSAGLSYEGARHFMNLIEEVIKNVKHDSRYKKLESMAKNGNELSVFPLFPKFEGSFTEIAKRSNLDYCILKDKFENLDVYPLIVRKSDENKLNRIYEKYNLYDFDENPTLRQGKIEKASDPALKEIYKKEIYEKLDAISQKIGSIAVKSVMSEKEKESAAPDDAVDFADMDRESIRKRIADIRRRADKALNAPDKNKDMERVER